MDFSTALHDVKKTVDREFQHFFTTKRIEAKNIHPETIQLVDQIADLTSRGGKRTRAFLVWLGYQSVIARSESSSDAAISKKYEIASPSEWTRNDMVLHAMMGIELFQSFALIHDDIIDEDAMRRGSPTVHEYFKSEVLSPKSNVKDAKHFGESMAILAGDLALAWADELMGKVKSLKLKVKSDEIYQKMKEEVIFGQSLDVLAAAGLPSADRAAINRYKTAWYSVVRPLQIGACIAGAEEKTMEAFVPYGLAVGEGYQLRDDFLDGAISQGTFQTQSTTYENQATQAAHAIRASVGVAALLTDFARFALNRDK
ncbi:MAG: polyprenyl synthetase family protein [Patescibacteria group bacterium]